MCGLQCKVYDCVAALSPVVQVQESMDDWAAGMGAAPQRRDRPQGWRDGQDRYGVVQQERVGFARPRGLSHEPYQVGWWVGWWVGGPCTLAAMCGVLRIAVHCSAVQCSADERRPGCWGLSPRGRNSWHSGMYCMHVFFCGSLLCPLVVWQCSSCVALSPSCCGPDITCYVVLSHTVPCCVVLTCQVLFGLSKDDLLELRDEVKGYQVGGGGGLRGGCGGGGVCGVVGGESCWR